MAHEVVSFNILWPFCQITDFVVDLKAVFIIR